MRKTITGMAIVAGALLVGTGVEAQSARFAATDANVAQAAALEAKAATLYSAPKRFNEAARMLERAAELRPAGDAQQIDDLWQAARLYHYAGNGARARAAMLRAADTALATGHVVSAASTYLDAAYLHAQAGFTEQAKELIGKAELLSRSPTLSEKDRKAIVSRLNAA